MHADLAAIWLKVAYTLPSSALKSISPNPPPESGREVTAVADGVAAVPATKAPTPVLEAHVAYFITASAPRTPMKMPTKMPMKMTRRRRVRLGSGSKYIYIYISRTVVKTVTF